MVSDRSGREVLRHRLSRHSQLLTARLRLRRLRKYKIILVHGHKPIDPKTSKLLSYLSILQKEIRLEQKNSNRILHEKRQIQLLLHDILFILSRLHEFRNATQLFHALNLCISQNQPECTHDLRFDAIISQMNTLWQAVYLSLSRSPSSAEDHLKSISLLESLLSTCKSVQAKGDALKKWQDLAMLIQQPLHQSLLLSSIPPISAPPRGSFKIPTVNSSRFLDALIQKRIAKSHQATQTAPSSTSSHHQSTTLIATTNSASTIGHYAPPIAVTAENPVPAPVDQHNNTNSPPSSGRVVSASASARSLIKKEFASAGSNPSFLIRKSAVKRKPKPSIAARYHHSSVLTQRSTLQTVDQLPAEFQHEVYLTPPYPGLQPQPPHAMSSTRTAFLPSALSTRNIPGGSARGLFGVRRRSEADLMDEDSYYYGEGEEESQATMSRRSRRSVAFVLNDAASPTSAENPPRLPRAGDASAQALAEQMRSVTHTEGENDSSSSDHGQTADEVVLNKRVSNELDKNLGALNRARKKYGGRRNAVFDDLDGDDLKALIEHRQDGDKALSRVIKRTLMNFLGLFEPTAVLPVEEREKILGLIRLIELRPDELLLRVGESSSGGYLVGKGELKVYDKDNRYLRSVSALGEVVSDGLFTSAPSKFEFRAAGSKNDDSGREEGSEKDVSVADEGEKEDSARIEVWELPRVAIAEIVRDFHKNRIEFVVGVMRSQTLFDRATDEELYRAATVMRTREASGGEVIIKEGDEGEEWFIVESGTCFAVKGDVGTGNMIMSVAREYASGDCFGELALFGGLRRASVVVSSAKIRLLVLDKVEFLRLVGKEQYRQQKSSAVASVYALEDGG